MKVFHCATFLIIGSALLAGLGSSCGQQSKTPPPLREAYTLMDQGQNARAIELLEKQVTEHPEDAEARVLLASAYVGQAGLNIYKLYDSFHDILFSHPLWDTLSGKAPSSVDTGLAGLPTPPKTDKSDGKPQAPVARLAAQLDAALDQLRKVVAFLNRFPNVKINDWPLLDTALDVLEPVPQDRGISLYRVFVRIVYLKAYINAYLVSDQDVGTRAWVCGLDFAHLEEHLIWVRDNLTAAEADFKIADPKDSSSLIDTHTGLDDLLASLRQTEPSAPDGSMTTLLGAQSQLHLLFACDAN